MDSKLNVGLIGLGRLGGVYAGYFAQRITHARLAAVADADAGRAQSLAHKLGVPKWYEHYQDLLGDQEIDAVVIVTPTKTHGEIVIAAAQQGKAIFCEKPLSLSLSEARAMQQAVERAGVFFHPAFTRRFDKGYVAAKRKIEEGVLGTPLVFKSSSRDPYRPSLEFLDPRQSGGIITDMGIHDLDLARWLMGEIRSVYSIGGVIAYPEMKPVGDQDNTITTIYFANGTLGVVDLSRSGVYGYDIRTEVMGSKGTLQIGYLRETPLRVLTKEGVTHDAVPYFMERFEQAYIAQLQDFVDKVIGAQPPSISVADGVAALQACFAATRSFKENRPVDLTQESVEGL
jgi:scyllo-inositol 2-dehydrogenase (NAD+)